MLYVFLVDTGKMVTFDMNHAVESVEQLKAVISQRFNVPPEKQVLLISGGESLQPAASVGSYSAGTDTSPIFFFNKVSIESDSLVRSSELVSSDQDMSLELEAVVDMPPSFNTVVTRTQLAQEFCERARMEVRTSELLVHEQHLQQQGWAAVVANLEDMTASLRNNAGVIEQELTEFLRSHQQHTELLESLDEDIVLLGKIPVLPALLSSVHQDEQKGMMLLDWINSTDSKSSLKDMADQCKACLKQLVAEGLEKCRTEVQKVMEMVSNPRMLEIRGVEEWLYNLDELMARARKLEQDQQEHLQSFVQNQSSFSRLKDPSVLPDLSESHVKQLKIMLQNHEGLRDIRRRCVSAKDHLSKNLKERLRWVIYVEKVISEAQLRFMFTTLATRQLRRQLEICRQIHMAPHTYLRAVTEVIRRRHFSHNFLQWAGTLSSQCQQLHQHEVQARRDFNSQFSKHFLHALFPGMDDLPPPFATRNPKPFDDNLPPLAPEDLEFLRKALPEMSELLHAPDTVMLPTIVLQQSGATQSCQDAAPQPDGEASSSCIPPHASCQQLQPEATDCETDEALLSASEKECRDGTCPEDRERTPKLAVSDDEFEEVTDEPTTGLDAATVDILGMPAPQDTILCSPDSLKTKTAGVCQPGRQRSKFGQLSGLILSSTLKKMKQGHTSQDFQTADFYIDESMPSSISDSNGVLPAAPGVVAPTSAAAAPVQQAHVAAELQRQLEEKSAVLLATQKELERERVERQELRHGLTSLCEAAAAVCSDSRSDAASLREDLAAARQMLSQEASLIGAAMDTALQALLARLENEKAASIAAEVDRVQREFESAEEDHRHRLEVERLKLEDAHREIRLYQQQLQQLSQLTDSLRNDSTLALATLKNSLQQEQESALAKATLEHELEQEALQERLRAFERSHEEEVQDLNECICEKDRQIQMLFQERQGLEEQLHSHFAMEKEELLAQCRQECAQREQAIREELVALHEQQLNRIQHCHEEAIQKAKEQTRLELQQEWESRMPDFKLLQRRESIEDLDTAAGDSCSLEEAKPDPCGESMMESTVKLPHSADPMLLELRSQLLEKQNEVNRLQQQVMAMSDNFGTQLPPSSVDKVSILTCQPGDIVLLCYDEGHQNYVLFVLGPNLHFLHTDCLDTLGLKTAPGTVRKGWVLAEVVEKEFCQARKPQNRYHVPAGTRFYRVKAKPWDKEAAVRREQQRRSSLRSLTQSSLITASSAVEEVAPPPPAQSEGASAGEPYPQPVDS
ncbi:uncharacterized protein LOC142557066 isoform X1 [Dermacentor variabilis]|uniref:uncharacterized protein LOC142557066 isoform X1 n=1 Tax=Dermacentor variabilis TaxID=34621 RepID=UPI003F5C1F3C